MPIRVDSLAGYDFRFAAMTVIENTEKTEKALG